MSCPGQCGSEQYVLSWTVWFWIICLVLDSLVLNSMSCPGQCGSEQYVLSWTVWFWIVCLVLDSLVLNSMSCPGQCGSEQYVLSWTVWFWTVCLVWFRTMCLVLDGVWFWTVCLVLDSLVLNSMSCPAQFCSEQNVLSGQSGPEQSWCSWTLVVDSQSGSTLSVTNLHL